MSSKGYIKLYRQLQDGWIWNSKEKYDQRSAWVDLLLMVNHKDKKIQYDDGFKNIKRGQILTSKRKLAERWMWNRRTVDRFLTLLEKDKMVAIECTTKHTLITIINYDIYQAKEEKDTPPSTPQDAPPGTPQSTPPGTPPGSTNNNDNNEKNDKKERNIYNAHFEEFWKIYPRHDDKAKAYRNYIARLNEGYSEQELLKAAQNYKAECDKEQRIKKYIKMGSTFLGIDKPFTDYLKGGSDDGSNNTTSYESSEYDPFSMGDMWWHRMDNGRFRG